MTEQQLMTQPSATAAVPGTEAITPEALVDVPCNWYVVVMLAFGYSVNFLDRQVINILGQSIKTELQISDVQLGLLTGTAFGIFYSVLGIPIARLADRTKRVDVIAAALLIWSGLTCLCGLTHSYAQLFMVRLGVGVGEAGGTPPSQSLISDYVALPKRIAAFSLFNLGVPLGSLLGFLFGGYINDWFGWRTAFLLAGIPGVIIAVLVKTTIKEPIRGAVDAMQTTAVELPDLRTTLRQLMRLPTYTRMVVGSSFSIFTIYVTGAWLAPLFIRLHGFSVHQIGAWLALCAGLGGAIGAMGGGAVAAMLRKRWHRHADFWVVIASGVLVCPTLLVTVLTDQIGLALTAMFFLYVFAYCWMGTNSARVQEIVPVRSRALAVGLMLSISTIIGLACGPPLVGLLSDVLQPTLGVASLRAALAVASVGGLLSALGYFAALRHLDRDLDAGVRS